MEHIIHFLKRNLKLLPVTVKQYIKRIISPKLFYFIFIGIGIGKSKPISNCYGLDRGTPIDRYYIENFLKKHEDDIKGVVLELLNNTYTRRFGGDNISKSEVLDIDYTNKKATITDDLRTLTKINNDTFDCIILTQVLQFIDNLDSAVAQCHRVLKPGGTLLATLPALSRIDCVSGTGGDFWRFTGAGAKYLIGKHFKSVDVTAHGNVSAGHYFLAGVAQKEISKKILEKNDPNFPVVVTVRAQK